MKRQMITLTLGLILVAACDANLEEDKKGRVQSQDTGDAQVDTAVSKEAGSDTSQQQDIPPETGGDGQEGSCPSVYSIKEGDNCAVSSSHTCPGSGYSDDCNGNSTGSELCRCNGKWICINWSCPSWCPYKYEDATKGPACTPSTQEQFVGGGACYYESPDFGLCTCSNGKVSC